MNWTGRTRGKLAERLPMEELLPTRLPAYVRSSVYLLGMLAVASLILIFLSGIVLIIGGPQWWHLSAAGHFFNSLHFWSVQLFFFTMVLHLWAQYFMGAWRDGRAWTWVTGVLAFLDFHSRCVHGLSRARPTLTGSGSPLCQGRLYLSRSRRDLQRARLRPDAGVSHLVLPPHNRAPGRRARIASAHARRGAPISARLSSGEEEASAEHEEVGR